MDHPIPAVAPPRQTKSYLQALFAEHNLEAKSKMGQNFLIDLNLIDLIVRSAELSYADLVLEVGTGTGSLTSRLAAGAGAVVSVELDRDFHRLAAQILAGHPNLTLVFGDILARKNELNPEVLSTLDATATAKGTKALKLVANLPYVVATPVICNLLLTDLVIERMVVMVQWEIAEKMVAAHGTGIYSSLSVLVQSVAEVEIIRRLPPETFWPAPKVDSAIVLIKPDPERRAALGGTAEVVRFRHFLRDLYTHRRKNLRSALAGWPDAALRRKKPEIDALLETVDLNGDIRAEDLTVEEHLDLARAFLALPG